MSLEQEIKAIILEMSQQPGITEEQIIEAVELYRQKRQEELQQPSSTINPIQLNLDSPIFNVGVNRRDTASLSTRVALNQPEQEITGILGYDDEEEQPLTYASDLVAEEITPEVRDKPPVITPVVMPEEGINIIPNPDIVSTDPLSEKQAPEEVVDPNAPVLLDINDWVIQNQERLSKIDIKEPMIPADATEEEAEELRLDAWKEAAAKLYDAEIFKPWEEDTKQYRVDKKAKNKEETTQKIIDLVDDLAKNDPTGVDDRALIREEDFVPALREILPPASGFDIHEVQPMDGSMSGVKGTGTKWSMNNVVITNPNGVKHSFDLHHQTPEELKEQLIGFLNANPDESDPTYGHGAEWVEEKNALTEYVKNKFLSEENIYNQTGQFDASSVNVDDLRDAVKADIGWINPWWGKERTEFLNVTDSDVDDLVGEILGDAQVEEKNALEETRINNFEAVFESENGGYIFTKLDGSKVQVNSADEFYRLANLKYVNNPKEWADENWMRMAQINNALMYGNQEFFEENYPDVDIEEARRRAALELQSMIGEGGVLEGFTTKYDMATGETFRTRDNEENPYDDTESSVDITDQITKRTEELAVQANESEYLTPLEFAEARWMRILKLEAELNKILDAEGEYDINLANPEAMASEVGFSMVPIMGEGVQNISGSYTLRDILRVTWQEDEYTRYEADKETGGVYAARAYNTYSPVPWTDVEPGVMEALDAGGQDAKLKSAGQFADYRRALRQQMRDIKLEKEALKRMFLLNQDVTSISKGNWKNALDNITSGTSVVFTNNSFGRLLGGNLDVDAKQVFKEQFGISDASSMSTENIHDHILFQDIGMKTVVRGYEDALRKSGQQIDAETVNYIKDSLGEEFLDSGSNMIPVVVDFALTAGPAKGVTMLKVPFVGKSLSAINAAWKEARFTNAAGQVMTKSQIATKVANATKYNTISSWMKRYGYTEVPTFSAVNALNGLKSTAYTAMLEGSKFKMIGGDFSTGAGFGVASSILGPWLGTIKADQFTKNSWLYNNAPWINKVYELGFKTPTSFVAGSEMGELTMAIADDAIGSKEFETFFAEHYPNLGTVGRRVAMNYALGAALNVTNSRTYSGWKTMKQLREAKKEYESYYLEPAKDYIIYDSKTNNVIRSSSIRNYRGKRYEVLQRKGDLVLQENLFETKDGKSDFTKEGRETYVKYKELADAAQREINRAELTIDLTDPFTAPFMLDKIYKKTHNEQRAKGYEVEVKTVSEKQNPEFKGRRADVTYFDAKGREVPQGSKDAKKVRYTYNVDRIDAGTTPHEVGHAGMVMLFGENARFKADFINKLFDITKTIKVKDASGQEGTLYDRFKQIKKSWDIDNAPWEAARITEWELFSYTAEYLAKPENAEILQTTDTWNKLKDLVNNTVGKKTGQKYNFKRKADIVRFFGDYIESVNQGKGKPLEQLEHLRDVIDLKKTEKTERFREKLRAAWEAEGFFESKERQLRSESLEKKDLVERNKELFENKPEGWKQEFDTNVERIKTINDQHIINYGGENESNADRKSRVNRIYAAHSDVIFDTKAVGSDAKRRGEAVDAILESYKKAAISIARKSGMFETPTFENLTPKEKPEFAWEITKPIMRQYFEAFNREYRESNGERGIENDDLDGYLNSRVKDKLGTAVKQKGIQKKEFTGRASDLKPSQEPVYVPSDLKLNSKTDARLKVDIRERFSDMFKDYVMQDGEFVETVVDKERNKSIEEGINELNKFVENFIKNKPAAEIPTSYADLKNIEIPKEIVDKLFGKNTKQRIETIGKIVEIAQKSAMPMGTVNRARTGSVDIEGRSVGVRNTLQSINIAEGKKQNIKPLLYDVPKAFGEFVSKKTGRLTAEADPTGQGNTPKELIKEPTSNTLAKLGIKEVEIGNGDVGYIEDFTLYEQWSKEPGAKPLRKLKRNVQTTTRQNYMEEVVRGMVYQAGMENLSVAARKLGITTEVLSNQIGAGKARLASRTLELQDYNTQVEFLEQLESKEFKGLYNKAMREFDDGGVAFEHALATHFSNYRIKNPEFGISKADLKKIATQLQAQFRYTTMKPERAIEATMKTIAYPNSLEAIEAKYGFEQVNTIDLYDTIEGIREGQAVYTMEGGIIEQITRELGEGAFESLIKEGISKGAGLGTYRAERRNEQGDLVDVGGTVVKTAEQNMIEGNTQFRSSNRFGLFETATKAQEAADAVYARMKANGEKLNPYKGSSRASSDGVGKKNKVLEGVTEKDGTWSETKRAEFDRIGEENKKSLFNGKGKSSVVETVMNMYANGDITYRQVRQIVEGQGGPMEGLIKKSASLAVLPGMSRKAIEAIYGKNWVLEHTTPAQYVKARIYEYILSEGKAPQAKALELTLRDYHTTLIPESLDAMVNKILKTNLPATHLPGMDPIEARYYEAYHRSPFDLPLVNYRNGRVYSKTGISAAEISKRNMELRKVYEDMPLSKALESRDLEPSEHLRRMEVAKQAVANARNPRAKKQGMSTFDFDETLIVDGKNFVIATKDGKRVKISSEQWPIEGPKYAEQGYEFDFSDFANVRGGTDGPLLQKMKNQIRKYGSNNVFVLTARQQASAEPIHNWLKSRGIEIPLENITGLGKSEGSAKAQWMLEKFAEGYNDMYFVDDALPNVEAVKQVLSQLDVKSNVQQARRLASQDMSLDFNKMIERVSGVDAFKTFSGARAKMAGQRRYTRSIVVPGAQDFMGLMQNFMGKGKQGNADRTFFEENLVKPFARATKEMNESRQRASDDLKGLYKDMPSIKRKLNKKLPNSSFTYDQAIRTYLWKKAGFEIPELSARDLKALTDVVRNDAELMKFAEQLSMVGKGTWSTPGRNWVGETIVSDLFKLNSKERRAEYLEEWQGNVDVIFSPENLNKIEATQGAKFREALEDILYRMKTGSNRPTGANRLTNQFNNWINGSVGATMFLNMRSAMLQTISATNYINWSFNNPAAAARAFGNQKQYWKDFSMLWNSPMLKQRRAGLEYNVQEAELAAAMAGQKNKAKAAVAWLIKKGFTPTQIADSFAIASGGATHFRNNVRRLMKTGLSKAEAEQRAFLEFQELTETNQQSSRADLISQQQASGLGRTILAWSNTPMQYMRIQEKAARDIVNGRGDLKTNMSKIAYYGVIQSAIFSALQNALFRFGLEEEDENNEADNKDLNSAIDRTINTVIDSQLRGTGVLGAALSAIRNTVLEFEKQEAKAYDDSFLSSPDHSRTVLQLTSFSPVISSKLRKLYSAGNEWNYNREAIKEMGFDINNPAIHAAANVIEATTNLPLARLVQKVDNIQGVLDSNNETWQRVALLMGYPKWQLGIEDTEVEEAKQKGKDKAKAEREAEREIVKRQKEIEKVDEELAEIESNMLDQDEEREQGAEEVKCAAVSRSGKRCSKMALPGENFCTIHQQVAQQEEEVQCSHIKKDGKQCKMKTKNKSGKCYYHD